MLQNLKVVEICCMTVLIYLILLNCIIKNSEDKNMLKIVKKISPFLGESYLQRTAHRLSTDFSKETPQAGRGWKEVFKVMKGKDLHPRLLYPAKLSFKMEGQIKCFPDKVKLKELISTKTLLYEMLKGFI